MKLIPFSRPTRDIRRSPIRLLYGVLAVISAVLTAYSIRIVATSYILTVHYDEWNFIRYLAENDGAFPSLKYLFSAHNEHIIATYRVLQWVDFKLFDLTHGLIIAINLATQILNAYLFTRIICLGLPSHWLRPVLTLATAGVALSLAQWENLLAAFQVAFAIELTGALWTALIVATPIPSDARGRAFWWISLTVAFALATFSLGNGIALPILGVFTLVALRRKAHIVGAAAGIGLPMIGVCVAMVWPRLIDSTARNLPDLMRFATCLLGSPFSSDPNIAVRVGVALLGVWTATFGAIWRFHPPRLPRDVGSAAIMCFSLTLLATLGAIAWSRAPLGLASAFSNRYATFTLFLWLCVPGFWLRQLLASDFSQSLKRKLALIPLACIVAVAAWSGLRSDHLTSIEVFRANVETGGYFIASGAIADADASTIAPRLPMVEPALAFLRNRRLNVFSSKWISQSPTAEQVGRLGIRGSLAACPEGSIDRTDRLDRKIWAVTGWMTDLNRRAVQTIFASDGAGRLLGLTRPLQPRPDVNRTLGMTKAVPGFRLPIVWSPGRDTDVMIVALALPESASCSLGTSVSLRP